MLKKYSIALLFTFLLHFSVFAESGQNLRQQADILREEGKTIEAMNLYNQALIEYQKEHNYSGILEVLNGKLIAWQHLYNRDEDKIYAILAQQEAKTMLVIAEEYHLNGKEYLIHFLLGKSCIFLHDYLCAESEFRKALNLYPFENAEKGDWMAHLGEAIYQNGHKAEGERIILEGVTQIQLHKDDVDSFRLHVWLSGAYLRLAKILIQDHQIEQAKIYLEKGETIITKDSRLIIRKQQLDKLRATL